MTEAKLQSDCFQWVYRELPHLRPYFFLIYNNPKNAMHGAILKGMGLRRGPSDQVLLLPGTVVWIECKLPGEGQSKDQQTFQQQVEALGMRYYLYHSLPELLAIFEKEGVRHEYPLLAGT